MNDNGEKRKALRLHGRVQGVGFRWWAQRQGERLQLRGFVRNCPDGTVEIAFAGPAAGVDEMSRLLQDGPRTARVDRVESLPEPDSLPDSFRIGGP
ncbi:MAG: acylphosphatase [Gemmatimonadetes bacterium]|uniref:Acylphosphatase n=1 Tax=Candidatus Kutchimonas denitrificans TaxID=3056748 RepID=A0AAE4Z7X5_9BACT|nr:acylphosphatase [Gemmatimonadota bacterium]NIR74122.1 acylphosphatase [Candidatus Kutchimonas denitrificans]NIS01304.1 acylphosphatase [Gemmatimonadota bacterium]NIT67035.1 acylphosphatase [Gemmatimonadota bacterium]NIU51695.1 acylphosphatase [Gemmatimonadota bacterium]